MVVLDYDRHFPGVFILDLYILMKQTGGEEVHVCVSLHRAFNYCIAHQTSNKCICKYTFIGSLMKLKDFLDKMKSFFLLSVIFLSFPGAWTVTHSLKYFHTGSSGIKYFPEFVAVGMVDDQQITYYDSVLKKVIHKQDWMAENEDPEYWKSQTQAAINAEQDFKADIAIAMQSFNQTGGVIVQQMVGCEWDDETGEVKGFNQFGYDGEDYISFDLKTQTWMAPKPQARTTKQRWERRSEIAFQMNYLTEICPEHLKKYVNYGKTSLLRTEFPSVSVLQKPSSSLVRCLATGFYPNRAEMLWRINGEETHEGVEKGEILPNNDGTFQMIANLTLPSEKPEDWMKYECVFQLAGVSEDVIARLEKQDDGNSAGLVIGVVVCLLVLVIAGVGVGLWLRKKENLSVKTAAPGPSRPSEPAGNGDEVCRQGLMTQEGGSLPSGPTPPHPATRTLLATSTGSKESIFSDSSVSSDGSNDSEIPLMKKKNRDM